MADGNLYMNGVLSDLYDLEKKIDPDNLGDEYCWQTDELLAAIERIRELAEEIRQLRLVEIREKILRDVLEKLACMGTDPDRVAVASQWARNAIKQVNAIKDTSPPIDS